jgi:glycosyltransferase involved in cell wall biosynthesis
VVSATVVVPSRDRPAALAECLRALGDVDVVVVDDASVDGDGVAAVVGAAPRARLLVGDGRGPAAARNLGVAAVDTEVVCFTDDDCRPRPGWVDALVAGLDDADADVGAVAGPTVVDPDAGSAAVAAQVVTNHLLNASLDPATGRLGFAPTSNLAVRTDVMRVIPFDESFPLAAGEDRDWCVRLAAVGHDLRYEPEAVVDHHPDLDLRRFWRQQLRYGRGAAHFRSTSGEGLAPRRFYADLLRRGAGEGATVGALVVVAQAATATGIALERLGR